MTRNIYRPWEHTLFRMPEDEGGGDGSGDGDEGTGDTDDSKGEDKKPDDKVEDKKGDDDKGDEGDDTKGGDDEGEAGEKPGEFGEIADFKVPDGMSIDEKLFGELAETDFGKKLTKSDVQDGLGFVNKILEANSDRVMEAHNSQIEGWAKEWADSDTVKNYAVPEGEEGTAIEHANKAAITAAIHVFPDVPGELWNSTGFGGHPEVLAGLAKLYKTLNLSEGSPDGGGKPKTEQSKKSRAERMFPQVAATSD